MLGMMRERGFIVLLVGMCSDVNFMSSYLTVFREFMF